ncbi:sigma-70 family RNA polymerase sigma factor [Streptacidiphilus sp. PB12-B1b]|uniref:RNA polymerase sigma factor n=1 Tax=Streptacidiphilus sp. PB12-B1b TaxID=2705012 RepID=UPI0015F9FA43|nr:sigma-70 family RNA polymerase sigma factor [Streptacidiphilus sp. PB12-B1b]QMU76640.1 sigma-70 family RNA polymerase sigma factor [Streptacidiphilus sp. PB12-B1b]
MNQPIRPDDLLAAAPVLVSPERLAQRRETLTLNAFVTYHHKLWLRYATLQVVDGRQAAQLVRQVCEQLAQEWDEVLLKPSVPQYAWTVLKDHTAAWLGERSRTPVVPDTKEFRDAISRLLLREATGEFDVLESELGLYGAIAELPERQYDVITLRYAFDMADHDIAATLGITAETVRSHAMRAKRRLAVKLKHLLKEET